MFSKADIEYYFTGEKQQAVFFMGIAAVAVLLALVFFFQKSGLYKGAAIPILVIGLMMGGAGYVVFQRSDKQRVDMVYAFDMNPDKLRNEELPRMQGVMRSFLLMRYIECVLFVAGLIMVLYFRAYPAQAFWKGFGLALAIMALLALLADFYAERRSFHYIKGIQEKMAR